MSKRKAALAEAIEGLHGRIDDERYRLQHAASLLELLARTCQNENHAKPEEAWHEAEFIAGVIADHVGVLGRAVDDLERLGMNVRAGRQSPTARPPRLRVVAPAGGDAA